MSTENIGNNIPPLISNSPPPLCNSDDNSLLSDSVASFQLTNGVNLDSTSNYDEDECKNVIIDRSGQEQDTLKFESNENEEEIIEEKVIEKIDSEWNPFGEESNSNAEEKNLTNNEEKQSTGEDLIKNNINSDNEEQVSSVNIIETKSEDITSETEVKPVENIDFVANFDTPSNEVAPNDDAFSANWANFDDLNSESNQNLNNNEPVNNDGDNDDDFADFVVNPSVTNTTVNTDNLHTSNIPNNEKQNEENVSTPSNNISIQESSIKPPSETQPKPSNLMPPSQIDLTSLIDSLFSNININISSVPSESQSDELIIDCDDIWKELKSYTSVTDASLSLKFKWYLSNLEDNYLDSLSLQRVACVNKSFNSGSYSSFNRKTVSSNSLNQLNNNILKPVKVENTTTSQINNSNKPPEPAQQQVHQYQSFSNNNNLNGNNVDLGVSNDSNSVTSPVLDLDLSYFEKNIDKNNTSSKTSNTSSSKPTNSGSKTSAHLDKLLKDIFVNNNNNNNNSTSNNNGSNIDPKPAPTTNSLTTKSISSNSFNNILNSNGGSVGNLKKEDDEKSDKKSLSSSSTSSSSSNIHELSIQLQPHKLEQQQYLDLIQTSHLNDREALEFMSKLPNLSFMKSKTLVFPLKQNQQQPHQDK